MAQTLTLKGFARVRVAKDGKIIGDSDWVQNTITQYGLEDCIAGGVVGDGTAVAHMALGEGSAPATDDGSATLDGEVMGTSSDAVRQAYTGSIVTAADGSGVTCRWIATFSSSDRDSTFDIANIGLYSGSSGTGLMAGTTYSSTNVGTNQDVYASYEWQFATA
jgi:hypothetical protein